MIRDNNVTPRSLLIFGYLSVYSSSCCLLFGTWSKVNNVPSKTQKNQAEVPFIQDTKAAEIPEGSSESGQGYAAVESVKAVGSQLPLLGDRPNQPRNLSFPSRSYGLICWTFLRSLGNARKLLLSEIYTFGKLMFVMPVTNAVSERSFSALKRVKTYRSAFNHGRGQAQPPHASACPQGICRWSLHGGGCQFVWEVFKKRPADEVYMYVCL